MAAMPTAAPPDLLTAREVAEMLRVTDKTVRNWADEGRLPQIVLPMGTRRFRRSDVEALLTTVNPTETATS